MTEDVFRAIRRTELANNLRDSFLATLDARVERYLQIGHHPIVSNTPFAAASSECIDLFRDGHYYGAISLSQAVGEAVVRHMCQCNGWRPSSDFERNVRQLLKRGFIEHELADLCATLWKQRHDFHHLNATVPTELSKLEAVAAEKVRTLAQIEGWTFHYAILEGKVKPTRPQYWRQSAGDTVMTFLRLGP